MMAKRTREQYREQTAAKVAAAQEVLAAEVGSLVSGEDWRQFLDFQAKLHDYSANNVMLIFAQHAQGLRGGSGSRADADLSSPDSRRGGRSAASVERGQHGYAILAPMRATRRRSS